MSDTKQDIANQVFNAAIKEFDKAGIDPPGEEIAKFIKTALGLLLEEVEVKDSFRTAPKGIGTCKPGDIYEGWDLLDWEPGHFRVEAGDLLVWALEEEGDIKAGEIVRVETVMRGTQKDSFLDNKGRNWLAGEPFIKINQGQ